MKGQKRNAILWTVAVVAMVALTLTTTSAKAAPITTWGTPTAIDSNDDIVNPGNVIHAVNFGNETGNISVIVGGILIQFDPTGVSGGAGFKNDSFFVDDNPTAGSVAGDTNSEFHRVLDSFRDNGNSSYTFTGLTGGDSYTLQVFQSDDRANRTVNLDVDGTSTTWVSDDSLFRSSYVIADVTLGATDTQFTLTRTGGAGAQINAAVLSSAVSVPEPSSLAVFGIGACGLVLVRRRRTGRQRSAD